MTHIKFHGLMNTLEKGSGQRRVPTKGSVIDRDHPMWGWVNNAQTNRETIPKTAGHLRERGLRRLSGMTHTRLTEGNKREFLLHRGSPSDFDKHVDHEGNTTYHKLPDGHTRRSTSWTPDYNVAHQFGGGHVMSAWVHEDDVHALPLIHKIQGTTTPQIEKEVIVRPSKPLKLLDSQKTLINSLPYSSWEGVVGDDEKVMADDGYYDRKDLRNINQKINDNARHPKLQRSEQLSKAEDYRIQHTAPTADGGAPMHDLSGTFPEDVYGPHGAQYYGHGVPYDHAAINALRSVKGNPNAKVKIYRAVPRIKSNAEKIQELTAHKAHIQKTGKIPKGAWQKSVGDWGNKSEYYDFASNMIDSLKNKPEPEIKPITLNRGDWVTTTREYAKEHGEGVHGPGNYKIMTKVVPAKHVFTDGNSIHEYGYDPGEPAKKPKKALAPIDKSALKKAMHNDELERLKNKAHGNGEDLVDTTAHKEMKPDPNYSNFLKDPKKTKGLGIRQFGGISAKTVHKIGEDTFMAKPYHKKIESATRSWCKHPILGWATMATKKLYNSAGIGHLCEDVSYDEQDGVPLTVHKFAKGYKQPGSPSPDNQVDLQARQIAIMDYLTNNIDRHNGNILHDDQNKKLLAIDHERSFQYQKGIAHVTPNYRKNSTSEGPASYLHDRALNQFKASRHSDHNADQMADWWEGSKGHIMSTMEKEINHIKDPAVRDHIMNNFKRRHEELTDWYSGAPDQVFYGSMNTPIIKQSISRPSHKDMMKKLPNDPVSALKSIDGALGSKKSEAISNALVSAWKEQINKMQPDQISSYYNSNPHHHLANHDTGAVYGLLRHIKETNNTQAMQSLLKNTNLPPFWIGEFSDILKRGGK